MALSFAGNDKTLQKLLFEHMMAAGEIQWASRLAQLLDISDFESQVEEMVMQRGSLRTDGLAHSANAAALNGYLALELGEDEIVFCDTEERIRDMTNHFFCNAGDINEIEYAANGTHFDADHIVGLDVEWKPTSSKIAASSGSTTTTPVASILQISSSSRVFIIDLLALHVRSRSSFVTLRWLFIEGTYVCTRTTTSCLKVSSGVYSPAHFSSKLVLVLIQTLKVHFRS
ncbi:unnamed protein product [Phytophthora fragariaefolia]|uniref:Unnamed protein product n=1 Tax=Phytophthora fragariaefolia TaxID=1490495 RepID=A0A9W6XLN4_9STRA|nr:unnamed protein product [Phytophthora fragariaefolia]